MNGTDETYFTFYSTTGTITGYSDEGPKDVDIPSTIGGVEVKVIGYKAFEYKGLTSVTIPNSVTTIGGGAFSHNGPSRNSDSIPTSDFVGTWVIETGTTIWTKQIPAYASTCALANATVTVAKGTSEADAIAALDTTVEVVGTKGETATASIAWTIASYDGSTAGNYTATGKLTLPTGWTGTASDVTATVTVTEAPVTTYTGTVKSDTGGGSE